MRETGQASRRRLSCVFYLILSGVRAVNAGDKQTLLLQSPSAASHTVMPSRTSTSFWMQSARKRKPSPPICGSIQRLARILLPKIQAFFESEEGQREFAEWKAQQEKDKVKQG